MLTNWWGRSSSTHADSPTSPPQHHPPHPPPLIAWDVWQHVRCGWSRSGSGHCPGRRRRISKILFCSAHWNTNQYVNKHFLYSAFHIHMLKVFIITHKMKLESFSSDWWKKSVVLSLNLLNYMFCFSISTRFAVTYHCKENTIHRIYSRTQRLIFRWRSCVGSHLEILGVQRLKIV